MKNLGVKKGDRVALYGPNSIQWEISFYGLEKAGAILVPMNPQFKEKEVEYEINDSEAETIVVSQPEYQYVGAVKDRTNIKNIIVIESEKEPDLPNGTSGWSDIMAKTKLNPPHCEFNVKEDLATLVYTSGTTGLPKGTMLTHYNIIANIYQMKQISDYMRNIYLKENFRTLSVLPWYHIYGQTCVLAQGPLLGSKGIIMATFDIPKILEVIQKHKPNLMLGCHPGGGPGRRHGAGELQGGLAGGGGDPASPGSVPGGYS